MKRKRDSILDPLVLYVKFENQGGDWSVRIPNAYGDGFDFIAPISEELSLQFQPIKLTHYLTTKIVAGVGCIPLVIEPLEESENVQTS